MSDVYNLAKGLAIPSFCIIILISFFLIPNKFRTPVSVVINKIRYDYISIILIGIFLMIGLIYLAYPNYLDHVESTIAYLGTVMRNGWPLYPSPEPYPYHGILYGPGLAEIQWIFGLLGLPIIISSKIPGLISFLLSALILLAITKHRLARGYLLYLLPFGLMLFWDRPEPLFLLLVSLSLLLSNNYSNVKYTPILMAIFAGMASALKLHGACYVFAAYAAVIIGSGVTVYSALFFVTVSALSFSAFFLPQNVSLLSFFGYLKLASLHGLSLNLWANNLIYLLFISTPVLIVWRTAKAPLETNIKIALILTVEFFMTILGAKPGAGSHHLLPFIPINAFVIDRILTISRKRSDFGESFVGVIYLALIIPALLTALNIFIPMFKTWSQFDKASNEVTYLEHQYPGVVMGLTDDSEYPYAFLRVRLNGKQIDYPAYMDLRFSGVDDGKFSYNLRKCIIPSIMLPNSGDPFAMNNYYTGNPLFSSDIRHAFSNNYTKSHTGKYYSIYMCKQ